MTILVILTALIVLVIAALTIWRPKSARRGDSPPQRSTAEPSVATRSAPTIAAFDEHGAASHFEKDGKRPDSILRCTIQTGDNTSADFLDGLVGAYREGRFLRILMQNDESDDPRGYWHSWDVPWSQLVQIILRKRSTPTVHTDTRQPDGTYARQGPYLQTRLYKIGRGMECRLLDRDDPGSAAPFEWLKSNITDSEIRFAKDTQEDALYGDTLAKVVGDSLDGYVLRLKARAERAEDEEFSRNALTLADSELAELRAAGPKEFPTRSFKPLKDHELNAAPNDLASFIGEFDRWYAELVGEQASTVSPTFREYGKTVVERLLLGAIKSRYFGIFFYDHFPTDLAADGVTKAKLLQVVSWMRPGGALGVRDAHSG